jgi:ABC-type antimicrobial peptide transport system permease subunit
MIKNYIKIAWRNIAKNYFYSLINIVGLSVGIAFTLLIGAYVWGELQVNHQLKDADNQYIIQSKWKDPNMGFETVSVAELPKALTENYPGLVKNFYHFDAITANVSKGDKHFRENLQVGDSTMLKMYGFNLMQGNSRTALNDPFSVVITSKIAIKYFGRKDVMGQLLNIENFSGDKHDFKISGVLNDIPKNSVTSLNAANISDLFFNADAGKYFKRNITGWTNVYIVDYIELQNGASPKAVEKAMHDLLRKNAPKQISQNLTPYLVALKDYNLIADNGIVKKMTYTLSYIALFILLMAIINFVNICIGRSSGRMKEIGIRKVLGGLRKQLIWQFIIESILTVMLSTLLALIIYWVARPYFSSVLGKDVMGLFSFPLYFIAVPFLFALLIGLLAGIYPALVLTTLRTVDSLKGKLTSVKESVLFRKMLVAFQFATASVVFIGAVIISQQINLFFSNNLGYNKDYVVYAQLPRDWSPKGVQKMEAIRYQLAQMPEVNKVTLSYEIPDGSNGSNYPVYKQGANPSDVITTQGLVADNQYAATYNIPMKAGVFFKPEYMAADSTMVVINEAESKALGWKKPEDAIGQKILTPGFPVNTICGVTADFHFGSMQGRIQPITFSNVNYVNVYRFFSVKLKTGDIQKSLSALQKKWAILMPGAPFQYSFIDDALKKVYATELQLKQAAFIATILAIIIVLLGVLGLVSLSIQKRTKEIGIRKVLGSSVAAIISLFIKEFAVIILIAALVACPLAYFLMQHWLNDYAYKIAITLNPFITSIVILAIITTLLIVMQTIKAALTNPVKSLRNE